MLLERKISQLKNISELQPDKRWKATTKFEVLAEINSQNRLMKAMQLSASEKTDLFVSRVVRRLLPSASKVIAGFLIVFMGTGLGIVAQASVPGEPLWPIKRSLEKAELTLTLSPVRETEVHVKHVNERVNEIDKILTTKPSASSEQKEKAIKKAVVHLERDVKAVDTSLKVVREDKKPIEVVELAKKVKEATDETKNKVESIKTSNDNGNMVINNALNDVEKLTNETESTVLNIAVEVHDQVVSAQNNGTSTPGDLNGTTTSELKQTDSKEVAAVKAVVNEIISTEIDQLTNKIATAKDKVDAVPNQPDPTTGIATSSPDIKVVKDSLDEAQADLNEAKSLLQEGSVKEAVDKVVKTQSVSTAANATVKQLGGQTATGDSKLPVPSSTTTPQLNTTQATSGKINMQNITTTDGFMEEQVLDDGMVQMKLEPLPVDGSEDTEIVQ